MKEDRKGTECDEESEKERSATRKDAAFHLFDNVRKRSGVIFTSSNNCYFHLFDNVRPSGSNNYYTLTWNLFKKKTHTHDTQTHPICKRAFSSTSKHIQSVNVLLRRQVTHPISKRAFSSTSESVEAE